MAWPILLLFAIALFSQAAAGLSWTSEVLFPTSVLTSLVTGMMLVWSLRRWTLGITRKDGTRSRPGLGPAIVIVLVLVLAVGGPILISQTLIGFVSPRKPLSERLNPFADKSPNVITRYNEDDIDWRVGEAELALPLRVLSDIRAEFFLVMKDGMGKPIKYSRIGVWEAQKGPQSREDFIVKIGTLGSKDEGPDSDGGFAGHLNLTGESGEIHGVPDIEKWHLEALEVELNLYGGSSSYANGVFNPGASVRVGERKEMIDGTPTLTGTLDLEVRAAQIR
jgi:hypothetical protein